MSLSNQHEIRAVVGDEHRAMAAYDLIFPAPCGPPHCSPSMLLNHLRMTK